MALAMEKETCCWRALNFLQLYQVNDALLIKPYAAAWCKSKKNLLREEKLKFQENVIS